MSRASRRRRFDCCTLANNHVLDWGVRGLDGDHGQRCAQAGIGRSAPDADAIEAGSARRSDGLRQGPRDRRRPGIGNERHSRGLGCRRRTRRREPRDHLSDEAVGRVAARVGQVRRPGDLVVLSIHWGANWGYRIPPEHRRFAHALIDARAWTSSTAIRRTTRWGSRSIAGGPSSTAAATSSTTTRASGATRSFAAISRSLYFARMNTAAGLAAFFAVPFRIERFRLIRSSQEDARWLKDTLSREGRTLGTHVELDVEGTLRLRW